MPATTELAASFRNQNCLEIIATAPEMNTIEVLEPGLQMDYKSVFSRKSPNKYAALFSLFLNLCENM